MFFFKYLDITTNQKFIFTYKSQAFITATYMHKISLFHFLI